jgi:hypothetical protein
MNDSLLRGITAGEGAYGIAPGGMFTGQRYPIYSHQLTPVESVAPEMSEASLVTNDGLAPPANRFLKENSSFQKILTGIQRCVLRIKNEYQPKTAATHHAGY